MDFQRARSKEHKDQRLNEIITVACKQFENLSYDKISMASIAKELSFTRGSLYTYASTKEEIFLLVLAEDQKQWALDVLDELKSSNRLEVETFATIWARTYFKHERLLSLYSLMVAIIEKNVSLENLIQFKKEFFAVTIPLYDCLLRVLPDLSKEGIYKFYDIQWHYLKGLYPATQDNALQKEAIKLSGIPYSAPDFIENFTDFVQMILHSLGCK